MLRLYLNTVNNISVIIISVLIIFNFLLVIGVLFDLESWFIDLEYFKTIIDHLKELYNNQSGNGFNFVNIVTSLISLIGLLLFQFRNKAMTAQTISQYEIFNEDKQFSNFLDATRLLTDKNSTTEAKVAAMFSLADVAQAHPKHLERIIQVLNKELTPLIIVIRDKGDDHKYTSSLTKKKVTKKKFTLKEETEYFFYTENKIISFDKKRNNREKIKGWQYAGNETEKLVSVALYVIRKIILELDRADANFDFSNTVFFDIDHKFDGKIIGKKFIRKGDKRIENAIFLDCELRSVDFRETNFHYCNFINCDLGKANFSAANLWGTSFENCCFEDASFKGTECEGIELINCKKLTSEQLNHMNFKNIKKYMGSDNKNQLKYLMIVDYEFLKNSEVSRDDFITSKKYKQWKNNDKN